MINISTHGHVSLIAERPKCVNVVIANPNFAVPALREKSFGHMVISARPPSDFVVPPREFVCQICGSHFSSARRNWQYLARLYKPNSHVFLLSHAYATG